MPGRQINDPLSGKCYSLLFLPATPSSLSQTLKGLTTATAPFKGPGLASCIASGTTEIQGHHQVCRARRGGPRTRSRTADANLDCASVKKALVFVAPKIWRARAPLAAPSLLLVTFSPLLAQHQVHWMGGQCATLTLLLFWHSGATCSALICRHPEKASLSF